MKKAKFGVDWLLEAGDANVCHRYWFEIELEDEFYEELYQGCGLIMEAILTVGNRNGMDMTNCLRE